MHKILVVKSVQGIYRQLLSGKREILEYIGTLHPRQGTDLDMKEKTEAALDSLEGVIEWVEVLAIELDQ